MLFSCTHISYMILHFQYQQNYQKLGKNYTKQTHFNWPIHVWSGVAEIEQCHNGQADGQPIDKRHIVD